ncbi:MAG: dTMP kinase [Deltaproteobacteria bacterium]|nr:dTMP kinase [Candidatus Zymogenaceae bacterium]
MSHIKHTRGVLICFEGIDGSGKSLQAKRLASYLKDAGHDVVSLTEPTNGKWGGKIRDQANRGVREAPEEEYLLFMRDRRENVADNIIPIIERGGVVVLDRYYFSTIAYQGARGLEIERIRSENEAFAPTPDLLLFLDVPVATGLDRISKNRRGVTAFETRGYLTRVREIFLDTVSSLEYAVVIDGTLPPDQVFEACLSAVRRKLSLFPHD